MEMSYVVYSVGGVPLFSARLFITAFVAAFTARYWPEHFVYFPSWATGDRALFVLGVLAALENRATKSPRVAEFISTTLDPWIKPLGQIFFSTVVLTTGTLTVASATVMHAGLGGQLGLASIVTLATAAGVWLLVIVRNRLTSSLIELDSEDDLGLRRLLSWAEDGWAAFGMVFLIVFPTAALVLSGATVLGLFIVQKVLEAREKKSKIRCEHCGEPNFRTAIHCFSCHRILSQPRQVGAFGQAREAVATDLDIHRMQLISRRRCLFCASRLPKKTVRQTCTACGTENFDSSQRAQQFLAYLGGKLQHTLIVCTAFSLVPFLGLVPGIIYYRLNLLSGIRIYIPHSVGCLTRWGVRFINLVLLAFQWVPLFGAATLPLMCYVNYQVYRKVLEREMSIRLPRPNAAMTAVPVTR